ncbi:MAG TPA: sensor histidine kinase [Mycobacteriales bacterium]|nr:sensor histidine kinase [Mycobacteriales bacterium]
MITKRPPVRDIVLALACAFIGIVGSFAAGRHQPEAHAMDTLGAVIVAIAAFGLSIRGSHPLVTLAIAYAATLIYRLIGFPQSPMWLALVVALFTVVSHGRRWIGWAMIAVGYGTLLWFPPVVNDQGFPHLGFAVGVLAWVLLLITAAEVTRVRRDRAGEAVQRREAESLARVTEERLRIARELHDVLAHNISMINVQAGVALHLLDEHPEQGRAALNTIKTASKDTLTELRSILGVLRSVDEVEDRAPSHRLADLEALLVRIRGTGLEVALLIEGESRETSASVDLAGYRIVQESLTNVTRHSQATSATVRLIYGTEDLVIQVQDNGVRDTGLRDTGAPGSDPTPGNGITGMRERARALGGDVEAGFGPDGAGFRVQARLPLEET